MSHSRAARETNLGTKVTMQTPPCVLSRARTSSGTLRGWSQTARAEECEKITGASLVSRAARMVSAETCERSTSMPSRFISRTTSWPNAVSPPARGTSVAESAQGTLSLWVSVRYRTPSACSMRSVPSEEPMEWPPSAPMREAIRPADQAASISARVRAGAKSAAYRRSMARTKSTCSKVAVTAASPCKVEGT